MHSAGRDMRLTAHLRAILGDDGFVRLCEALGGTRVYVSWRLGDDGEVVQAVGREAADKLSREFAPATIRVPLAHRERALHHRAQGLSDVQIARRLGMTENGVGKLFKRQPNLPDRPGSAKQPSQLDLF